MPKMRFRSSIVFLLALQLVKQATCDLMVYYSSLTPIKNFEFL